MGRPAGTPDFPKQLVYNCCLLFDVLLSKKERAGLMRGTMPKLRRGRSGDPRSNTILKVVRAASYPQKTTKKLAKALTKTQLNKLLHRHMHVYLRRGMHAHRVLTKRMPALTEEQEREAAEILGEPIQVNGRYCYFRSVEEALSSKHRRQLQLRQIVKQSGMHPVHFGRWLCKKQSDILGFGTAKEMEALRPQTSDERAHCSDVWGGRVEWRRSRRRGKRGAPANRRVHWGHGNAGSREWPYYSELTVLIDAFTISTCVSGKKPKVRTFYSKKKFFPPELVRPADSGNTALWAMAYIAIHKEEGIVSGPDFMYWASKTQRGMQAERNYEGFPDWCGSIVRSSKCWVISGTHIQSAN